MTPYETITGSKPNLMNPRTFGCRVYIRKPDEKKAKLDDHTSNGVFVGYTSTMKNIYYINDATSVVNISLHTPFSIPNYSTSTTIDWILLFR